MTAEKEFQKKNEDQEFLVVSNLAFSPRRGSYEEPAGMPLHRSTVSDVPDPT